MHVGADRWSVEVRLDLGQPRLPRPQPGDIWGFNVDRLYRGREVSRWIRLDGRLHATHDFGLLRFR